MKNSCNTRHAPCGVTCPLFGLQRSRHTGLSGGIETKHQQAHFLAAEDLGQGARECGAHGVLCCCGVLWRLRLQSRWLSWSRRDALGADVLVRWLFLAGSGRAMVILLCDSRSVLGQRFETSNGLPLSHTSTRLLMRHVDLLGWWLSGLAPW